MFRRAGKSALFSYCHQKIRSLLKSELFNYLWTRDFSRGLETLNDDYLFGVFIDNLGTVNEVQYPLFLVKKKYLVITEYIPTSMSGLFFYYFRVLTLV